VIGVPEGGFPDDGVIFTVQGMNFGGDFKFVPIGLPLELIGEDVVHDAFDFFGFLSEGDAPLEGTIEVDVPNAVEGTADLGCRRGGGLGEFGAHDLEGFGTQESAGFADFGGGCDGVRGPTAGRSGTERGEKHGIAFSEIESLNGVSRGFDDLILEKLSEREPEGIAGDLFFCSGGDGVVREVRVCCEMATFVGGGAI